jgi:hypothetical protein
MSDHKPSPKDPLQVIAPKISPARAMLNPGTVNERFEKVEAKLEKLERAQAISQYFFKLMSDQNKELLKDGKVIVKNSQDIIDAMGRFDELCANWDENHPLMEAATKFVDYVTAKMKQIDPKGDKEDAG